jgi:hypothetical protein
MVPGGEHRAPARWHASRWPNTHEMSIAEYSNSNRGEFALVDRLRAREQARDAGLHLRNASGHRDRCGWAYGYDDNYPGYGGKHDGLSQGIR